MKQIKNSTIHKAYIVALFVLTIIVVSYYYKQDGEYRKEMDRINTLENERLRRDRELEYIRAQSMPCPTTGLNDPRTCYVNSGYKCRWNEMANRCDKK
jgi:hypothetical protein